jgi:hypothetical protein
MIKPTEMHYISPHGVTGWLVRVPYMYFYDNNYRTIKHKQKLFTFLKHEGRDKALVKAKEFRDLHCIKGLKYNDRGVGEGNGRQVRHKNRKRGEDLPAGICDVISHSKQGNEQTTIVAQAMCGNVNRSRSFMYGYSRSREEAILKAKETLAVFLSEIEDSLDLPIRE